MNQYQRELARGEFLTNREKWQLGKDLIGLPQPQRPRVSRSRVANPDWPSILEYP